MMIRIGSSSFMTFEKQPEFAYPESARKLLDVYLADLEAGKFDESHPTFAGFEEYLRLVIKNGGRHAPFPPYPEYEESVFKIS